MNRYSVACIQSNVHVADETRPESVEDTIRKNLGRNMELVDYLAGEPRYGPKLLVFSEFCLTGVPESRTLEAYQRFAVPIPGWVTEIIGQRAKHHGVHIACNTFESDPDWPGRVFNTSFIVGPDGNVILRYRKNNDFQTGIPASTNPGDFYRPYVEHYGGPEALFPVVDTELGRLACLTCFDIRFAEVARCLALQGAEVLIHPTAEGSGPLGWRESWDAAKQVRAWENSAYFISTNNGLTLGSIRPQARQRGLSKIIDYEGRILAQTEGTGECVVTAPIDLEALRQRRSMAGMNVVSASRFETYLPIYEKYATWPVDAFSTSPMERREQSREIGAAVIRQMVERGQLLPPESPGGRPVF